MANWQLTVGLEIHVELETQTKMFCSCQNNPFESKPNTNVCPVCYGLPGALPLLNKKAVEMTVALGRALNGRVAESTFWARKNYFYPDLPKGYQISQSNKPLVENATLVIDGKTHRINRIHLEEDAGKSTHQSSKTLVNYNRAGVPLLEMVTEPDFHTADEAKHFCQELQRVMRHLRLSKADMEKGQMRCEANISVASEGDELGTKIEVKNLNSFRSVERAINYEFDRQVKALEAGESLHQETRLWDEKNNKTAVMRTKETSADYRYFPEPDLRAVSIESSSAASQILPDAQRQTLRDNLGFPEAIAKIIVDRQEFDSIMETYKVASTKFKKDQEVKHFTLEDGKTRIGLPGFVKLNAESRLEVLVERDNNGWAKTVLEEIINEMIKTGKPVAQISSKNDVDEEGVAKLVIKENPSAVDDYKSGKEAALNFLVGQMMAKTKGRININTAREALKSVIS